MEQIKASPNPYHLVNIANIPRTPLPRPAPYNGISNPWPPVFQASVTVTRDSNLYLATATVNAWRPRDPDAAPLVTLSTELYKP